MSIFDKVKDAAMHQFIEVIEWLDATQDTIVYRFPVEGQEIKNGAQLIVRESQAAVFVFEGQVADVFARREIHDRRRQHADPLKAGSLEIRL